MSNFEFDQDLKHIWNSIKLVDQYINTKEPWKLEGQDRANVLKESVNSIRNIATILQPFLPETAGKILEQFKGPTISSQPPLFPRIV
jgi:methionyl-tRNA synthetase